MAFNKDSRPFMILFLVASTPGQGATFTLRFNKPELESDGAKADEGTED